MVPSMSSSTLQRLLHRKVHVNDSVAAQLRLDKKVQLDELTAPGVGEIKSTPKSAVDNIFLFVDAFNLILSFETG